MKCKADIVLTHKDGAKISIVIAGDNPEQVAHVANTIKTHYKMQGITATQTDRHSPQERMLMREFYDFARDFFRLRRS